MEADVGIEPAYTDLQSADPDLGKVVLYQLSYSRVVVLTGAIVALRKVSSSP